MTYDVITRARRTTRRRVTAILVAAVAAVCAVAATVSISAGPDRSATSPMGPVLVRPETTSDGQAALPDDLDWIDVAGVSVPVSKQSGPHITSKGQARGFTHDRGGAVLAAAHIVVRTNPQVGPTVFEPTLRTQVVGADAASMRVQVAQAYDELRRQTGVADGQPAGRLNATLLGYRIVSYTDDEAVLRLLTEAPDGSGSSLMVSTEVRMRWAGSDWALLAPAGGTFDQAVTVVLDPYTAMFLPFSAGR
ncbi:hypothetical protein KBX26_02950 [Micromonospora sp. C97]|uniref:hypothetical protein n=1 Tax=Micromonospora sp. C97 TaxID=2824883 RepID=UPI001B36318C|nr:hypothetical protein [Micromonospora sp. C97]MBQ1028966.1 hypothetical protein [Micromonospora sp. C97]